MTSDKTTPALFFDTNDSKSDYGFNHEGMQNFIPKPYYSTAREVVQNSIDSRLDNDQPLIVEFKSLVIDKSQFPGHEELQKALKFIKKDIDEQNEEDSQKTEQDGKVDQKRLEDFVNKALAELDKKEINVLSITDFNTKGMEFNLKKKKDPFRTMLKGKAVSYKQGANSLGSYGIGKFAPFCVSKLRTVCVRTHFKDEKGISNHLMQTRTILVNFEDEDGKGFSGEGWYGLSGENINQEKCNVQPLEGLDKFYQWLKPQEETATGTSINIMGFDASEGWKEKMKVSLLINYFAAIEDGNVIFHVDGDEINKDNYKEFLYSETLLDAAKAIDTTAITREFLDTKAFAMAYAKPNKILNIQNEKLGEFELSLTICKEEDEESWKEQEIGYKKVGFIRDGMFISSQSLNIFDKQSWRFGNLLPSFYAILKCIDKEGNAILRKLEDPTHSRFDVNLHMPKDEATDRQSEIKEIEKALTALYTAVRKAIHDELKQKDSDSKSFKLDFFPQLSGVNIGDKNNDEEKDSYTKKWKKSGTIKTTRVKKFKKTEEDGGNLGGRTEESDGGGTGGGTSDGTGEGRGSGGTGIRKTQLRRDNYRIIKNSKTSKFKVVINNLKKNEKIDILIKGEGIISDVPIKVISAESEKKVLNISKGSENWIKGGVADDKGCVIFLLDLDSDHKEHQYTVWYS